MGRLRNRFLILILLGMILLPQLYQAVHLVGHRHVSPCVELNVTHFHEKHPDCKLCVHVVPAIFAYPFDDLTVVFSSQLVLLRDRYDDQFFENSKSFFWLRGPPHSVFSKKSEM